MEVFVFVLLPCFLFVCGVRVGNASLIRLTPFFIIFGVSVNRFTVSMIALNWKLPHREFLYWKELVLIIAIITVDVCMDA